MRPLIYLYFVLAVLLFSGCSASKKTNKMSDRIMEYMSDTLTITPEAGVYKASETRIHDLLHTRLKVKFDWKKQYLNGYAWLKFTPYFYASDSLVLDARGFDIHNVSLYVSDTLTPLDFSYDSVQIHIRLNKHYTRNDTFEVFVDYTAKPNELKTTAGNAISSDKGLYFINPLGEDKDKPMQIWTQGEPEASSCWFPTIDAPNERTTQEIFITVNDKYKTLSNGVLEESIMNDDGTRTDHWNMVLPHAPYLFMMAVGDFAVVKDKWKNVEVSYYVEPKYEKYAHAIFGNTPEMIGFFSDKLGVEYPWSKYAQIVVRDFVSGAMENTTATIHMENLQQTKREMLDGNYEDYISHELFHQWFGDLVTCESWSNLPLNESFATYGECLWLEYKEGKNEADHHLEENLRSYLNEARYKQKNLIRFQYSNPDDMFDAHSYAKGGVILSMLRNYVGDEAFFQSLKLYLNTHKFQSVEIHDLRLAFEKVTGEDLNWFFDQWFLGSGHPKLTFNYSFDDTKNTVDLIVEQTPSNPGISYFKLPVKVDVWVNGKMERHEIVIDEKTEIFTLKVAGKPELVNPDAEKILLAEKEDKKSLDEWISQFNNYQDYFNKKEALTYITKDTSPKAKDILHKALNENFWAIREMAIDSLKSQEVRQNSELRSKLADLARNDTKSTVRAAAIAKLGEAANRESIPVIMERTKDSSYLVISEALYALTELDSSAALQQAKKLEKEKNENVQFSVGRVYAKFGNEDHEPYLRKRIEEHSGYYKVSMMALYNNYLLARGNDQQLVKASRYISEMASGDESQLVKRASVIVLSNIKTVFEDKIEYLKNLPKAKKDEIIQNQINDLLMKVLLVEGEISKLSA